MASGTVGLEGRTDIEQLRARYEVAAERPTAQAVDGLTFLGGLYLAASPWIVGFGARDLRITDLIVGVALAIVALGLAAAFGRTHGMTWVVPVLGAWTIVAPWVVLGSAATTAQIVSNVIAGAAIFVLGLGAMWVAQARR